MHTDNMNKRSQYYCYCLIPTRKEVCSILALDHLSEKVQIDQYNPADRAPIQAP